MPQSDSVVPGVGDQFEGRFRDGVHAADVSDLMRRMVKENLRLSNNARWRAEDYTPIRRRPRLVLGMLARCRTSRASARAAHRARLLALAFDTPFGAQRPIPLQSFVPGGFVGGAVCVVGVKTSRRDPTSASRPHS
jgi:hypothetical protein